MSTSAKVTLSWAGDMRDFRLGVGEIRDLEQHRGCGLQTLLRRIIGGDWRFDDLRETLRLGLIGAKEKPPVAAGLIVRYFDDVDQYPLLDHVGVAAQILEGVLAGWAIEPVGKPPAASDPTESPTG